jgi:hypothetical protein
MMLAVDAERAKAAGIDQKPLPGIDIALQRAVASAWKDLVDAWAAQDAAAASKAVAALAASVHAVNPAVYPDTARLGWESWYFRNGNLTRVWLVYMAAIILLLLGLVYRWPRALSWGLAVFGIAFLLQTAAVMLRWWISQRWPNSNMFEAVTTASWFGACCAAGLELWLRRRPVRGWFALTASACSMVALMAAHFLPVQLNPNISNMMPVLHDVWLYIHTNVIIFSYALIFMAAISAGGYLLYRWRGGPATYARAGGTVECLAVRQGQRGHARQLALLGLRLSQGPVALQIWIGAGDLLGHLAGQLKQVTVLGEAGQGQVWQATLTGAEHLARSSQAQIHLGDFKAVMAVHQHLQPLTGQGLAAVVDQQAVGCRRPAPHPAPQLVQLGQPEALGMFDHHHARLRHVHPHLHHRGGYQHLGAPLLKGTDGPLLLLPGHPPVQQAHRERGKHLLIEVAVHLHGGAQVELLRFLHQR